jgi:hypothetical protein
MSHLMIQSISLYPGERGPVLSLVDQSQKADGRLRPPGTVDGDSLPGAV